MLPSAQLVSCSNSSITPPSLVTVCQPAQSCMIRETMKELNCELRCTYLPYFSETPVVLDALNEMTHSFVSNWIPTYPINNLNENEVSLHAEVFIGKIFLWVIAEANHPRSLQKQRTNTCHFSWQVSDDCAVPFNSHCMSVVSVSRLPSSNKQVYLPLLLDIYPGKRGSHARKGSFCTLRPRSKFHG